MTRRRITWGALGLVAALLALGVGMFALAPHRSQNVRHIVTTTVPSRPATAPATKSIATAKQPSSGQNDDQAGDSHVGDKQDDQAGDTQRPDDEPDENDNGD